MNVYHTLQAEERLAVEIALDWLGSELETLTGQTLANDDRAARAAEALAVYIVESRA